MQTLEHIISEHPFFVGLNASDLHLLAGCAKNVVFPPAGYILKEGEEANQFFLLRQGRVALEIFSPNRKPAVIETLGPGEIMGWSWLLHPYHWKFHARAIEQVRAIALDGKCLRKKCEENHDLGYELLKRFAKIIEHRLEATRLQLLDVYAAH